MEQIIAPPKRATLAVKHAPSPSEVEPGSAEPVVYDTEKQMVGVMQELRLQAVERASEFDNAISGLHQRAEAVEAMASAESVARAEAMQDIQAATASALDQMRSQLLQALHEFEDGFVTASIPAAHADLAHIGATADEFYTQAVPARMAAHIAASRKAMQLSHESFDVQISKAKAWEAELTAGMHEFDEDMQLRVATEKEHRDRAAFSWRWSFKEQYSTPSRAGAQAARISQAHGLASIRDEMSQAQHDREHGDAHITDSMRSVMHGLQQTIEQSFGLQSSDSDGEPEPGDSDDEYA